MRQTKRILALDLATKIGFAYRTADDKLVAGSMAVPAPKTGHPGMRWQEFRNLLVDLADKSGCEIVAYEQVIMRGGPGQVRTGHVYGGYLALLELFTLNSSLEIESYSIAQIKKHATGYGSADKMRMLEAATSAIQKEANQGRVRSIGSDFDDNAADAYWILRLAESKVRG